MEKQLNSQDVSQDFDEGTKGRIINQIIQLLHLYSNGSDDIIIQTFDDTTSMKRPELLNTLRGISSANIRKLMELRGQGAGVFILNTGLGSVWSMTFPRVTMQIVNNCNFPPHMMIKTANGEHKCTWIFQIDSSLDFAQTSLSGIFGSNLFTGQTEIFHIEEDFFETNFESLRTELPPYSWAEIEEIIETQINRSPNFKVPGILFSNNLHHSSIEKELMVDNHDQLPIEETIRRAFVKIQNRSRRDIINNPDHISRPLHELILSGDAITNLKLPERESIIEPFLPSSSLSLLFAARGIGKTWFCLDMALSVSLGTGFLAWEVPKPRRVLYIDGEMPLKDIQTRLNLLNGDSIPKNLMLLSSERLWLEDKPLNLNSEVGQQKVNQVLMDLEDREEQPDLIIFDNLSSLCTGGDENSNSDLDSLLRYLVGLRYRGYAILLVHHAGKNGEQRGASRREDLLDTSIKLTGKTDEGSARGAKFNIEFTKCRGKRPTPDKLSVELVRGKDGGVCWAMDLKKGIPASAKYLAYVRDEKPESQAAIAAKFGVSSARVSTILTEARKKGHLEKKNLILTKQGQEFVSSFNFDE